jgi:aspartate racemase
MPDEGEQACIHDRCMGELVRGVRLPETREQRLAMVAGMKTRDGVDAVILGGTELLLLRDPMAAGIPLLHTTVIHAKPIVARALP